MIGEAQVVSTEEINQNTASDVSASDCRDAKAESAVSSSQNTITGSATEAPTETQVISVEPQVVTTETQVISVEPQVVATETQISVEPQVVTTETQISVEPQVVATETQVISVEPQAVAAETEVVSAQPQAVITETQMSPVQPQAAETTVTTANVSAKPARLTDEQIKELDLARRSDGSSDDWVTLYLEEFPPEEQRDVEQLRGFLAAGDLALHETRDKAGVLLTWSMSQDHPAAEGSEEPSFWLGCWTVTKRSSQSTGIGRVHFAKVVDALRVEKAGYIGRVTEIESTEGLTESSQPVRRAKFYKALGLQELDIPYEFPRYQPADATEYVPQAQLGGGIKAQLLFSTFTDAPVTGAQVRSIVRRIYEEGYHVQSSDPYLAERLALIDDARENYLIPLRILS